MAASVRFEDEAFSDERYGVLASLCGLADADHARGKMARLWRQCTAQRVYVLPIDLVCSVLGENAADALVKSRLGEVADGGIRIKGTKGRIEWLAKLRKNAGKGGKAKAAKRQDGGKQEPAKSLPPAFPPAPAPAPVQISEERESETPSEPVADGDGPIPLRLTPDAPTASVSRSRKRPEVRMPPEWEPAFVAPPEGVDAAFELAKFRDWAAANDRRFVDWQAAWRNWLRNATPRRFGGGGTGPPGAPDPRTEIRVLKRL